MHYFSFDSVSDNAAFLPYLTERDYGDKYATVIRSDDYLFSETNFDPSVYSTGGTLTHVGSVSTEGSCSDDASKVRKHG